MQEKSGDREKLKEMEDENRKLMHVVAELTLDSRALKRPAFQESELLRDFEQPRMM